MPWVAAIIAVIGAGVSAYQDDQNRKEQKKMANLAERQAGIGAADRATYERLYAPREEQLLNATFDKATTPAAEAARAGAEASGAADTAEQITLRGARRSGVNINSPAMAALTRKSQADRAGLLASARTYGRRHASDVNFNKQLAVLGIGRNLAANSVNTNSTAFNMFSALSAERAQRDQATGELYGQAAGYIGSGLSDYMKGRKKDNADQSNRDQR